MAERFEDQAKDAKTVGDLDRIIKHIFNEHGDTASLSFMVFSLDNKEQIYIASSKCTQASIKTILDYAKKNHIDINELLGPALEEIVNKLSKA